MYARSGARRESAFTGRSRRIWQGKPISSFFNQYVSQDANILSMPLGSLIYAKNLEYLRTGNKYAMRTRRGSTLIKDITLEPIGAGTFVSGSNEYQVYVDSAGTLNYYNATTDTITAIKTGLDTTPHYFQSYNAPGGAVIYGCNEDSNLYKVDASFAHSVVLSTPIDAWTFSNISGRGFGVKGHVAYYSNIQLKDALDTSNLETYNTTTQRIIISPGSGEKIYTVKDNGEITFFFKENGIWALINAEQDIANWIVPQCSINTGTRSPKSVIYSRFKNKNGFIFLGSDRAIHFFNGAVTRNSGTAPTLQGGGSLILSNPFEKILRTIPSGQLGNVTAGYFDRYYVLCFAGSGSTENDTAIFMDLEKTDRDGNPFWVYLENWDFKFFTQLKNGDLYGYSAEGYISQLFINNQYYDEVPDRVSFYDDDSTDGTTRQIAVRYAAYTYWNRISTNESRLYDCTVGWKAEGFWNLNFVINSYTNNDSVPGYAAGSTVVLKPDVSGSAYFDYSYFDQSYFDDTGGTANQSAGGADSGHFFLYGFYSDNLNEYATVYSIEPNYQTIFKSPTSKNR